MAKPQSTWKPKQPTMQQGKKGGYMSDKSMDFNKSQTIEELTGGKLKKKK